MIDRKTAELIAKHRRLCEGCKFDEQNLSLHNGCWFIFGIEYNRRLRRYECAAREEKRE